MGRGVEARFTSPVRVTESEWKLLRALPRSLRISEAARLAGVSIATASRFIKRELTAKHGGECVAVHEYGALGLSNIMVILEPDGRGREVVEKLPYLKATISAYDYVRRVVVAYLLAPFEVAERLKEAEGRRGIMGVFIGDTLELWRPDISKLTAWSRGSLLPLLDVFGKAVEEADSGEVKAYRAKLDAVDLMLVYYKEKNAFFKLAEIERREGVSKQLLAYHMRRHYVKYLWRYNGIRLAVPQEYAPLWLLALEGSDASRIGRALSQLPYTQYVFTSSRASLSLVQLPSNVMLPLARMLSGYDVDSPWKPLLLDADSLTRYDVRLHELWDGMWKVPEELEALS